jgi:putative SOS response-associated peptidase YedK
MCYYMGQKVTRAEFIRLMAIEKELRNLKLNRKAYNGFEYKDWPIIRPIEAGKDFVIENVHWEYIPGSFQDEHDLVRFRQQFDTLNAKAENLFVNEKGKPSIWADGAMNGRCLFIASYFFEWMHMPKYGVRGDKKGQLLKTTDKYPFCIRYNNKQEYFFIAGISRTWTNYDRNQSALTAALLTTKANSVMEQIHNTKKRMPTILPEHLAWEWIQSGLSKERIMEIASYQLPSEQLEFWTVQKNIFKVEDPTEKYIYKNLPAIAA